MNILIAALIAISASAVPAPNPTVEEMKIAEAMRNIQDVMIDTLRKASKDYPVPYVRDNLREIIRGVDNKSIRLALILNDDPAYRNLFARFRRTPDGRPMIEYYLLAQIDFLQELEKRLGDKGKVFDALATDWYVYVTLHEWAHYKKGHRYGQGVTPKMHMKQESEAWHEVIEKVVVPAAKNGRFQTLLDTSLGYAGLCYKAANGNTKDKHWKTFVRWFSLSDETADVNECLKALEGRLK